MDKKYEYLDEERKKLWLRIEELEDEIKKLTPESIAEVAEHSNEILEFRNDCEQSKLRIESYEKDIQEKRANVETDSSALQKEIADLQPQIEEIKEHYSYVSDNSDIHSTQIKTINSLIEKLPTYQEKLEQFDEIFSQSTDTSTKITNINKAIQKQYKEIKDTHLDIFGHSYKDDEDKTIEVYGLVDELNTAYNDISDKIDELSDNAQKVIDDANDTFSNKIGEFKETYEALHKRIEELLPNALTTGLSYAYAEKRKNEEKQETTHTEIFTKAIWGLIGVSAIIFIVSIVQLIGGKTLNDVILQMPRVVLAILPLYIPVLWLAYSAAKKRNLSKRLIEEYTHKEVLSKTYEGLSTQIAKIEDTSISSDLRVKLLYNVLEVTSTNPGKLISDYKKSDHPFMEALNQSVKLASTVDKISKIPGLDKLAQVIVRKNEQKAKEVMNGLNEVEPIEKENNTK